ncbi:amino acid ABC transporter substrate-binding protein [Polaromonas sp.]|nr:amino acid ABC transporter substrate-binding protein [Polaromonas sp.]
MFSIYSAAIFLFSAFFSLSVQAQSGTLEKLRATQVIKIGINPDIAPFSFLNAAKQPAGYAVDVCEELVNYIKKETRLPNLAVKYVLLTDSTRISNLKSGGIDMECGASTNTKARQEEVGFSYTYFVAGLRVLSVKNKTIATIQNLNGLKVAVIAGATSEKLLMQVNAGSGTITIKPYSSNTAAFKALQNGEVQAMVDDDLLLLEVLGQAKATDQFQMSNFALSVEPYAIMLRKDDTAFQRLLDSGLAKLFASEEIRKIYNTWFVTDALNFPVNRLTHESMVRPNKEPGVAMLLGYSL